jgi:mobilome CxxCx(11)CxxC protein
MLNSEQKENIKQRRMDALVAIELHKKKIRKLQETNKLVEVLSIAVPALYLTPRLLAKGTFWANLVDVVGEILAACLLVLVIFKLVYKWQDDEIKHTTMSRRNKDTIYEANRLLESTTATPEVVEQFLRRVQDIDDEDQNLLSNTQETDRQEAYREVLRKVNPSATTTCPNCGADPWHFISGNCQLCGGTPVTQRK